MTRYSLLNLSVRMLGIVFRFLLIFFLARELSPQDLGQFNILVYSVMLIAYVLGFNFYTFSTREIVRAEEKIPLIISQIKYQSCFFLLLLPAVWGFSSYYLGLGTPLAVLFVVLVGLELVSTEFSRVFIALERQLESNIIFFMRSSAWGVFLVAFWLLLDLSYDYIFYCWVGGSFLSVIYAVLVLRKNFESTVWKFQDNEMEWIKSGVVVALPFFLNGLVLKISEYASIFLLDYHRGDYYIGIYTFFLTLQNVALTMVYVSIIAIYMPKLLDDKRDAADRTLLFAQMKKKVFVFSFVLMLLSFLLVYPTLLLIDKEDYFDHLSIYFVLGAAILLLNLSHVYSTLLYVLRKDKVLFYTNFSISIVSIVAGYLLIGRWGMTGAAATQVLVYLLLLLLMFGACRKTVAGQGGKYFQVTV